MGRKRRPWPKARGPLSSRWLAAGIGSANRFGFYLFEEPGPPVAWTVYDRGGGWAVARYWPATGRWGGLGKLDGHAGTEPCFRTIFARLAELLGRTPDDPVPDTCRTGARASGRS
jgi:hypothetical protein